MRDRKIIEALILLALPLAVFATFKNNWWTDYKIFDLKFFLVTSILTILFLFLKNKNSFIVLLITLLFINYAGIGSVSIVYFLWFSAYLIGKKIYEFLYKNDDEGAILEYSALGFSIIGLIVTISSHFPINFGIYYISLFTFFYLYIYATSFKKTIFSLRKYSFEDAEAVTSEKIPAEI